MTTMATSDTHQALAKELRGRMRGPVLSAGDPGYRRLALAVERDDRPASGRHRSLPRHRRRHRRRRSGARARAAALDQGRRAQHRRACRVRGRPDARHVADARRVGRPGGADRARAGRVPPRRRRSRDAAPRPGGRARLRLRHRLRRSDARRRVRLSHAALRLDHGQRRSMDLVTAEGTIVRASENENSDLFWGLRGGGGNFGVVTGFEYKLHPVGPEIVGGAIAWRAEEAARRARAVSLARGGRAARADMRRRVAPRAAGAVAIAKDVHGKPIVAMFVCYSGPLAEGEKRAGADQGVRHARRRRRAAASLRVAADRCSTRPSPRAGATTGSRSTCAASSQGSSTRAIEQAKGLASPHSAILVFPLDGRRTASRPITPPSATATRAPS